MPDWAKDCLSVRNIREKEIFIVLGLEDLGGLSVIVAQII